MKIWKSKEKPVPAPKANEPDVQNLHNQGVLLHNPGAAELDEKTLVVVGAPRGGTSMVAGVMHELGIFMGKNLGPVYEDVAFSQAVENGECAKIEQLVEARNQTYPVWGWKRPSSVRYLGKVEKHLRNPCYVVVFRDIFAIANRNRISMMSDVMKNMKESLAHYQKIVSFLSSTTAPCLLVSYEKALLDRENFVGELARFAGVEDARRIKDAAGFIRVNPSAYLLNSRITEGVGVVDVVKQDRVSGWAFLARSNRAARIELIVNGAKVDETAANRMRPDLLEKKKHPTGQCGFVFHLGSERTLQAGDEVRVRVVGDVRDLGRSPQTFGPVMVKN